jgi:hypothetical protein
MLARQFVHDTSRLSSALDSFEVNEGTDPDGASKSLLLAATIGCNQLSNVPYIDALVADTEAVARQRLAVGGRCP